ncbi:MAG: peptidoglycan DD-metalloendopeptidase family protein [Bacteroidota bacterium]
MSTGRRQNIPIGRAVLGGTLAFLALTLLLFGIVRLTRSEPPSEVILSPLPPYDPYDSIRTDLSDYLWPTDASNTITSTFGEFRRTHFHAGIDIRTHDRTGFPVFASRDGYVSRIWASPNGYGKMLHVRHTDNYTTTYAHLDRFAPDIHARAVEEQKRKGAYPLDIECVPHEFPVRKGDVIAFSGESGTGSPHLHFEIRDENLNAINPLLCPNLTIKDDMPPFVRRVAFVPIGHESTVNGRTGAFVLSPRKTGEDRYVVSAPVHVTGAAGLAIDNRDRSNGTWFRHGIYRNTLLIDGDTVFSVTFDRVPTKDARQIGLYYIWSLLRKGRFQKLYSDSPNDLPMYEPREDSAGIITSALYAEGTHDWRVAMKDIYGNTTDLSGTIIINHPPSVAAVRIGDSLRVTFDGPSSVKRIHVSTRRNSEKRWRSSEFRPGDGATRRELLVPVSFDRCDIVRVVAENSFGTLSPPAYHFVNKPQSGRGSLRIHHENEGDVVRIQVSTDGLFTSSPIALLLEEGEERPVDLKPLNLHSYAGAFVPAESCAGTRTIRVKAEINGKPVMGEQAFALYPIVPGTKGSYRLDDGRFILSYNPESTYRAVFLSMEKWDDNGRPVYSLLPRHTVLRGGLEVIIRSDAAGDQKTGLYFRTGRSWNLRWSEANREEKTFSSLLRHRFGEVTVRRDTVPPWLGNLSIRKLSRRMPRFSFRFGDDLAGIDYDGVKAYIDDNLVVPEIDGEHRRAFYQFTQPLERGSHQLTVHVRDNVGNTTTVERRFLVR